MGQVTISAATAWLLAVAAGLVTFSKAWELIRRHLHPEADLREKVKRQAEMIDADHRRLKELETQMDDVHKGISVLCQTQLAQLNHTLTGNNIERLREARDRLNDYLVNR